MQPGARCLFSHYMHVVYIDFDMLSIGIAMRLTAKSSGMSLS